MDKSAFLNWKGILSFKRVNDILCRILWTNVLNFNLEFQVLSLTLEGGNYEQSL